MLSYRGRTVTAEGVSEIRALIASEPGASRWALSKKLCEAWNWEAGKRRPAGHGLPGPDAGA